MNDQKFTFVVTSEEAGVRLDIYLSAKISEISRSQIAKLNKDAKITVNNRKVKSGYLLQSGETVVCIVERRSSDVPAVEMPLNIVYEDDEVLVVNKAPGIAVHPGKGTENDTLVNALLFHTGQLPDAGASERPGIVHRLDKFTSGLLVVAKTNRAMRHLRAQFDTRTIHRLYWALVWGQVKEAQGTIDTNLNRSRRDPTRFTVTKEGRRAITHWKLLDDFQYAALVQCVLDTGRTHQIRVHMNHINHPVIGDGDYNGRESQIKNLPSNLQKRGRHLLKLLTRQALHAKELSFIHPATNEEVRFEAPLPEDMAQALEKLPQLFLLDS